MIGRLAGLQLYVYIQVNAAKVQNITASACGNLVACNCLVYFVSAGSRNIGASKIGANFGVAIITYRVWMPTHKELLFSQCLLPSGWQQNIAAIWMSMLSIMQPVGHLTTDPQSSVGVVIRLQQCRDKLEQNSSYIYSPAVRICHSFKLTLIPSATDHNVASHYPLVICI